MSQANAERTRTLSYQRPCFRIRAARAQDLSQIAAVLLASFYPKAQATQWLYWLMRMGIQEDIKTRMKTPASQYTCLVATTVDSESAKSGSVIGTAEISQRACEAWRLFPPKRAYLSNLAVSPIHRRQGTAYQLLRTCENIALNWGFRSISLHVMADNQAAWDLYAQAGYHPKEVSNPILSRMGLRPQRILLTKPLDSNQLSTNAASSSKAQ